jgi:hypothetical protein
MVARLPAIHCGCEHGANEFDHLFSREAMRDHDRLGAAIPGRQQFELLAVGRFSTG